MSNESKLIKSVLHVCACQHLQAIKKKKAKTLLEGFLCLLKDDVPW